MIVGNAQMVQGVDDLREFRRRDEQDRHLHREPRADHNADKAQQTCIRDDEIPHPEFELRDGSPGMENKTVMAIKAKGKATNERRKVKPSPNPERWFAASRNA